MVTLIEGGMAVMEAGSLWRARPVSSECWNIKLHQVCVQTAHLGIVYAAHACVHGGKAAVVQAAQVAGFPNSRSWRQVSH